jgi:hypothetical protein
MKKFILILLLIPSICFSEIKGFIEIGKDINSNISYTELQFGYDFKLWNIILMPYGNQMTWFEYKDKSGYPFRDTYSIGTDLKFYNVAFNISHFCSHPVYSDKKSYCKYNNPPIVGQLTKISVRYDF